MVSGGLQEGRFYGFRHTGVPLPGWPRAVPGFQLSFLPLIGEGVPNSGAIFDRTGQGDMAVAAAPVGGFVTVYPADANLAVQMPISARGPFSNALESSYFTGVTGVTAGDLDGDGITDVFTGGSGLSYARILLNKGKKIAYEHAIMGWNSVTGEALEGFPQVREDHQFFVNPGIADLDGDGRPEAISGSGTYLLTAFNSLGEQPAGFPKFTGGWLSASPGIGDVDGDGLLEVVEATREGNLYVWDMIGPTWKDGKLAIQWTGFGHDPWNTRNTLTELESTSPRLPPTPTPTNPPTPTSTPTATPTTTSTVTATETFTPSPTPSATPGMPPFVRLAGHWDTQLAGGQGTLRILALVESTGPGNPQVELGYEGQPIGVLLTPMEQAPGLYGLTAEISGAQAGRYPLEILVSGDAGQMGVWPYVEVKR